MAFLKQKAWSPYVTGIFIGLLQIPAILLIGKTLGASTAYGTIGEKIASIFHWASFPNETFANLLNWWQVFLLIGVFIGAYLSSKMSATRRKDVSPVWKKTVGIKTFFPRAVMAFIGGFLLILGARIAHGCASGHGLSGLAKLQVNSFITIMALFASAIFVASFMRKLSSPRRK